MNKDKIKNIVLVMIVAVVSGSLSSILTTNSLSGNKLLGSVSYSDYLDSSNVTYLDSNVQDSIDNLYTKANDYSSINNRVNALEGYFKNNPSLEFSYNTLSLGINTTSGYGQLNVYRDGVPRGLIWATDNGMGVSARDSEGTAHVGMLDLRGNPIKVNGTNLENMIVSDDYTINNIAINGNDAMNNQYNISLDGYKPLISTCSILGTGTNISYSMIYRCYITGNNVYYAIRNFSSSASNLNLRINVLYAKKTSS